MNLRMNAWIAHKNMYLSDTPLHDQEVGVVDVELYTLKEGLHGLLRGLVAIEEVLGEIRDSNLPHYVEHDRRMRVGYYAPVWSP